MEKLYLYTVTRYSLKCVKRNQSSIDIFRAKHVPCVTSSLDQNGWWSVIIMISFVFWYLLVVYFVFCQTLITEREGFPVEEQIILYAGKPLQDGYQLAKLNDLSTLDIEVRMLGGNTSFFVHKTTFFWRCHITHSNK